MVRRKPAWALGLALMFTHLQDIFQARSRIAPFVRHTPLEWSRGLGAHLKLENLQRTGSFKLRGALNRLLMLTDDEKRRGVVTASAGNHAQGVAFGCAHAGVPALIVMPETTPRTKIEATRSYGVEITLFGATYDDAEAEAHRSERESGRVFISPYNDPLIIAGQGTVALEILDDLAEVAQVLVPAGGGGLICGVGIALKAIHPAIRVIGVTARAAPAMYNHLKGARQGQARLSLARLSQARLSQARLPQLPTLAEGLSGEVEAGAITLDIAPRVVDDVVLVEEDELRAAIVWLVETHHLIAEGSGAVGVAALLARRVDVSLPTVAIVTGGNLDIKDLRRLL